MTNRGLQNCTCDELLLKIPDVNATSLGHEGAVDNVVLNILGVETEDCSLGVGTEAHVEEGEAGGAERGHDTARGEVEAVEAGDTAGSGRHQSHPVLSLLSAKMNK